MIELLHVYLDAYDLTIACLLMCTIELSHANIDGYDGTIAYQEA
jgi:hypothetical protein